jgi:formylglycine-generating enzyme required for sulfatase activity
VSKYRVLRGGSDFDVSWLLRSAYRRRYVPVNRGGNVGFRLVVKRRKQ